MIFILKDAIQITIFYKFQVLIKNTNGATSSLNLKNWSGIFYKKLKVKNVCNKLPKS